MARLFLIRHGQISANVSGLWHGSTDSAMTAHGYREATQAATHLETSGIQFQALYASPLLRTRETARIIGEAVALPVQLDADLREYGIGELEGTPYRELRDTYQFFSKVAADHQFAPSGGESVATVAERMVNSLRRIALLHANRPVLVVSHGAAMGVALGKLLHDDPVSWTKYALRNCSITELEWDEPPRLQVLNRVDHLQ